MALRNRIRAIRGERLQRAFAERVGVSVQAVSQWERGITNPSRENLKTIASKFDVELDWLLKDEPELADDDGLRQISRARSRIAPLLTTVQAGHWTEISESAPVSAQTKIFELAEFPSGDAFALEIVGESMEPQFERGDVVIIDTGVRPLPGDFVVAKLNNQNDATFKKYRVLGANAAGNQIIELVPMNADYPTLTISEHNPGSIIGTMIEHRRYRRRARSNHEFAGMSLPRLPRGADEK